MSNKIIAVVIYDNNIDKPNIVAAEYYLNRYNFIARRSIKELVNFCTKEVTTRIVPGAFLMVDLDTENKVKLSKYGLGDMVCSFNKTLYGYTFCIVTNSNYGEYNMRNMILELSTSNIKAMSIKYEALLSNSSLKSVQDSIESVKNTMLVSISQLLERGEKLDDLIEKSNDISMVTKEFKKNSDKLNSCCYIL